MSKSNSPKTIKELAASLSDVLQLPDIAQRTMKSLTSIITVMSIILETGGKPGWHKEVNRHQLGQTLDEKDEQILQPLVAFITALPATGPKQNLLEPLVMKGGGIDINNPYYKLVDVIKGMDAKSETKAIIPRIEEAADKKKDATPFAILKNLPVVRVNPILSSAADTPIPVRLIKPIGKTLLDILRLLSSMPGMDIPLLRQVFSVALSSVEFYSGEWKQALLSGAGVFSQTAMYSGFFAKLFLNIFSLISPNLQDDIVYGAFSVTKSIAIGALLYLFQITATQETRIKAINFFKRLSCKNEAIDKILKEKELPGQPANKTISFSKIQTVQSASQDWTLTCSKEFRDFIGDKPEDTPFTKDPILKLLFQMLNMPTSLKEMDISCRNLKRYMDVNGYLSFKDLLVLEAGMTAAKLEELSPTVAESAAVATASRTATATETAPATPGATSEAKPVAAPGSKPEATSKVKSEGGSRHARRPSKRSSLSSSRKKRKSQPLSR